MPHVTIKLYPGQEESVKQKLAEEMKKLLIEQLHVNEGAVSVSIMEVKNEDWKQEVYDADISDAKKKLYIAPEYHM